MGDLGFVKIGSDSGAALAVITSEGGWGQQLEQGLAGGGSRGVLANGATVLGAAPFDYPGENANISQRSPNLNLKEGVLPFTAVLLVSFRWDSV